ncbi:MAG: hypothetical protein AB7S75_20545 [Desulfococcaceae bacterium]
MPVIKKFPLTNVVVTGLPLVSESPGDVGSETRGLFGVLALAATSKVTETISTGTDDATEPPMLASVIKIDNLL